MQSRVAEAAGAAATATAGADFDVDDERASGEHPETHTKQVGGGPAIMLAPDDAARVSADRTDGTDHVTFTDAAADAADHAARNQHRRSSEREARAVRAL